MAWSSFSIKFNELKSVLEIKTICGNPFSIVNSSMSIFHVLIRYMKLQYNLSASLLEDKGKLKVNSCSQPSGSEGGSYLLKSGTAPLPPGAATSPSKSTNGAPGTVSESEEEKAKKLLYCSLCKVAVNSLSQLEAHNTG